MIMSRSFFLLISIGAAATAAWGHKKPDFSGTWKVNGQKTDYGVMPGPRSTTLNIEHKDPDLKLAMTGGSGERALNLAFTTDGSECTNYVGDTAVTSKVNWDGAALAMEHRAGSVLVRDRWSLSEDGRVLTIVRKWSGSEGEATQTIVSDKQ